MEADLSSQIPKVFEIFDAFGIQKLVVDGYEADDVIGTMAKRFGSPEIQSIIVSNDRDLWQLVNGNVIVLSPNTKGEAEWIGHEEVRKRMGIEPSQVPDYKGLRGDPSDNIPGVYGVGEKTALKLIQEYGSVEEVYKNLDKIQPETLKGKLAANAEEAMMSKKLATIITDAPFTVDIEDCGYNSFDHEDVKKVLEKYNFKSLLRRLGYEAEEKSKEKEAVPDNQVSLF